MLINVNIYNNDIKLKVQIVQVGRTKKPDNFQKNEI